MTEFRTTMVAYVACMTCAVNFVYGDPAHAPQLLAQATKALAKADDGSLKDRNDTSAWHSDLRLFVVELARAIESANPPTQEELTQRGTAVADDGAGHATFLIDRAAPAGSQQAKLSALVDGARVRWVARVEYANQHTRQTFFRPFPWNHWVVVVDTRHLDLDAAATRVTKNLEVRFLVRSFHREVHAGDLVELTAELRANGSNDVGHAHIWYPVDGSSDREIYIRVCNARMKVLEAARPRTGRNAEQGK